MGGTALARPGVVEVLAMKPSATLLREWTRGAGWFYDVEQYPYAAADQYVTFGPFDTITAMEADQTARGVVVPEQKEYSQWRSPRSP